jgi:hypothetical protein
MASDSCRTLPIPDGVTAIWDTGEQGMSTLRCRQPVLIGQEPFDNIPEDVICSALVAILDRRNHPVLIHCNKGKASLCPTCWSAADFGSTERDAL